MNTDNIVLALATFAGLTTKGTALTTEFDENLINIYKDFLAKAEAGGLDAYDNVATYELSQAVTYNGRTWVYVNATPTDGITPGTDITYWVEIDPTALIHRRNSDTKLAEFTADEVSAADLKTLLDLSEGEQLFEHTLSAGEYSDLFNSYVGCPIVLTPSSGKGVVLTRPLSMVVDDAGDPIVFDPSGELQLINASSSHPLPVLASFTSDQLTYANGTWRSDYGSPYQVLTDAVLKFRTTHLLSGGASGSLTISIYYREI